MSRVLATTPVVAPKALPEGLDPASLPRHIAVIMDGNGRWAKSRSLPRVMGHREGVEALKEVAGPLDRLAAVLIGGIQSGMGYLGARSLGQLRDKARYIRVSPAGQREAVPHDVVELKTGS